MNPNPNPKGIRKFIHVAGGLGDVARRLYHTTTYEVLDSLTEPILAICCSHNPSSLELFRYHKNSEHLVILDVGHIFRRRMHTERLKPFQALQSLLRQFALSPADQLAKPRVPEPIRRFHAPDLFATKGEYAVIHPSGRGWGDWPPEVKELVGRVITQSGLKAYVLCADYIAGDKQRKAETFPTHHANTTVLKNLSAPAAFTLVAGARKFIGTMSSLAQVAALEKVPSVVLYPSRCGDFKDPMSTYAKTILECGGLAFPFDQKPTDELEPELVEFFIDRARAGSEDSLTRPPGQ
jgi:ADP-heptose:LPS heptosyltransferase